jgi:hypothetical protein
MANALPAKSVLTANDVRSGDIVFWSADERWTTEINEALISQGMETAQALLSKGQAEEAANRVVGTYLVALRPEDSTGPMPLKLREIRRLAGPSVFVDTETRHAA